MTQVKWMKCAGEVWCPLVTINVDHAYFDNVEGVYIIWHGGNSPATVYIGKGNIRAEIKARRTDPRLQPYTNLGLYVTWASVSPSDRDGIQISLSTKLDPKVRDGVTSGVPIEVNTPW